MKQFDHQSYTDASLRLGIRQLVDQDGYPWWRLAELSGYSESMLKSIANGTRNWGDPIKLAVFLRNLSDEGNHRLHRMVVSPAYMFMRVEEVSANGSFDDEVVDGTDALVSARKASKGGDIDAVHEAIERHEKVLHRLKAELNRMLNH